MQPPHGAYLLANTIGNGIPQVMSMTPSWWGSASFYSGPMSIHPSFETQYFPTQQTFVRDNLAVAPISMELLYQLIGYHGPYDFIVPGDDTYELEAEGKIMLSNVTVQGPKSNETKTDDPEGHPTSGYTLTISNWKMV